MTTKTKVACLLIAVVIDLTFLMVDIRSSNATAKTSSRHDLPLLPGRADTRAFSPTFQPSRFRKTPIFR
jgi:hypothetical protein